MKTYRLNSGIVVFRRDGKVLLCERVENYPRNLQFPQGGIDEGETPLLAALRELREETSVVSVKPVAALPEAIRYDFPPEVKKKNQVRGIFNDGQEQFWHLFWFYGEDSEINLQTAEPEFKSYCWTDIRLTPDLVVDFKHDVYAKVAAAFAPIISSYISKL